MSTSPSAHNPTGPVDVEFVEQVRAEAARLRRFKATYGEDAGGVMFLTGLSTSEIDELGGL